MNNKLLQKEMQNLEDVHGVRFVYIAEIGSRAWGYATEGSDYDIKAYYVQLPWSRDLLASLDTFRESFKIEGVSVDVQALDIRKALGNIVRSDASTIESFKSPMVYAYSGCLEEIDQLIGEHYHASAVCRVFLDLASANLYPKRSREFNGKSLIQALRFTLMAEQIIEEGEFVPNLQAMTEHNSLYGSLPKILNTVSFLNRNRDRTDFKDCSEVESIFSFYELTNASFTPSGKRNNDTTHAQDLFARITKREIMLHADTDVCNLQWTEF